VVGGDVANDSDGRDVAECCCELSDGACGIGSESCSQSPESY
jgi:hypothetical protein